MSKSRIKLSLLGAYSGVSLIIAASTVDPRVGLTIIGGAMVLLFGYQHKAFAACFIVLMYILAFQSTNNTAKFAIVAMIAVLAVHELLRSASKPGSVKWFRAKTGLTYYAFALSASIASAILHAHDVESILRDATPYLLFGITPLGLLALNLHPKGYLRIAYAVAILGTVGFTLEWLARRNLLTAVNSPLLSSASLLALGSCLGIARIRQRPKDVGGLLLLTATLVASILSGSRSLALTIVAIAAILLVRSVPTAISITAGGIAATFALVLLTRSENFGTQVASFLEARFADTTAALNGNLGADQSFSARSQAYSLGWREFLTSPIIGTGPGHIYPSGTFTLDAPTLFLAKLGLFGTVSLVILACTWWRIGTQSNTFFSTASNGLFTFAILTIPFGPVVEDKGLALAIGLIVAGALSDHSCPKGRRITRYFATSRGVSTVGPKDTGRVINDPILKPKV